MKRKLLCFAFTLCLLLSIVPSFGIMTFAAPLSMTVGTPVDVSAAEGDSVTATLSGTAPNYTLTISGSGAMKDYFYETYKDQVPWYGNANDITKIVIDDGVTSVGSYAFSDLKNVTEVTCGSALDKIGYYAFNEVGYDSKSISITFENDIKVIDARAFYYVGRYSTNIDLTFKGNIGYIGFNAFDSVGCYLGYAKSGDAPYLNITFEGDVAFLGYKAFNNAAHNIYYKGSTVNLEFNGNIENAADCAFYDFAYLTDESENETEDNNAVNITIKNIENPNESLFEDVGCEAEEGDMINIKLSTPDNCIPYNCFYCVGCYGGTVKLDLDMPNLEKIGYQAFSYCGDTGEGGSLSFVNENGIELFKNVVFFDYDSFYYAGLSSDDLASLKTIISRADGEVSAASEIISSEEDADLDSTDWATVPKSAVKDENITDGTHTDQITLTVDGNKKINSINTITITNNSTYDTDDLFLFFDSDYNSDIDLVSYEINGKTFVWSDYNEGYSVFTKELNRFIIRKESENGSINVSVYARSISGDDITFTKVTDDLDIDTSAKDPTNTSDYLGKQALAIFAGDTKELETLYSDQKMLNMHPLSNLLSATIADEDKSYAENPLAGGAEGGYGIISGLSKGIININIDGFEITLESPYRDSLDKFDAKDIPLHILEKPVVTVTAKSITVAATANEGWKYTIDGENYFDADTAHTFTGLKPYSRYTVTYRKDISATADPDGYVYAPLNVTTQKLDDLTASDFIYTDPSNLEYDGIAKTATVTSDEGIVGIGTITVKYFDANGDPVDEAIESGTYTVKIDVTEGEKYNAVSNLTADGWTFTIAGSKCKYSAPFTAGKYTILLCSKEAGEFTIEGNTCKGFTLKNDDGYLAVVNGEVKTQSDKFTWKYDGGLYVETKTTVKVGYWPWCHNTVKVTRQYLSLKDEQLVLSSCMVCAEVQITADKHTYKYLHNGDGKHEAYCTRCGHHEEPVKHEYGENGYCECGKYNPDLCYVSDVNVYEKKYISYIGSWLRKKAVVKYQYTICPEVKNVCVKKVEYAFGESISEDTVWKCGNSFINDSQLNLFFIRVTDTEGHVTWWVYEDGDVMLYYLWPNCFAKGTKITMADGSKKNIEDVLLGDEVLTFNHETGEYEGQKVYLAYKGEYQKTPFTLHFANGNKLSIVGEHDLFEQESMKYVTISEENVNSFVGNHFYNASEQCFEELLSVTFETDKTDFYSLYTEFNANAIADDMLSVPNDADMFLNIYSFDGNLVADAEQLRNDLAQYGVFEYAPNEFYTEYEYAALNLKYLNIVLGKGLVTMDEIIGYRSEYLEIINK